jgi:hypothetical protein
LQERSSLPHRFWEAEWDKGCNNVGHVVELNPMHKLQTAATLDSTSRVSTIWWKHA